MIVTKLFLFFSVIIMGLLCSCSSIRQLQPLDKGQSAVSASLGGPFTQVGSVYIPLPLLSIGYNRGIVEKKLDIETGFNFTQALFGIMDIDASLNYRPFQPEHWIPGLIVSPGFFIMTDFKPESFRFYPVLCITGFWKINEYFYIYSGIENWFELSKKRYDGNFQKYHWLKTPYIGFDIGKRKLRFQFETKIYTPDLKNTGRPTKNIGFGEHGILGIFFGWIYTFAKDKK